MGESRPKRRTSSTITERQKNLVDQLPNYNWNYKQAAIAAGYSRTYAEKRITGIVKRNVGLCRLIEDKRLEIGAKTEDPREKAEHSLLKIASDPSTKPTTAINAWDTLGKMNGWHSNTINLETPSRQAQLTALEQAEARRIAQLRFNALPAPCVIDGQVVDAIVPDRDDHDDNDRAEGDSDTVTRSDTADGAISTSSPQESSFDGQ